MSYLSPTYTFHDNPNEHMGGLLYSDTSNRILGYFRRTQVGANRDDDQLSDVPLYDDARQIVLGPADKGKSWHLTETGEIVKRLKE
jgi:hypothetical protein